MIDEQRPIVPDKPQSTVSDEVLKDTSTHPVLLAIIYFLGGMGVLALLGVIGGSMFRELPESVILMGSTTVTAVISGLAGFVAGQASQAAQAAK
jgi:ABC-type Na+ efflux pump permease subunit